MNILIVNDSPMLAAVLQAVVEVEPEYKVIGIAGNGQIGVEMALQEKYTRPDLVLMDLHMPKMNGNEAVKKIMTVQPSMKILITTATVQRNMSLVFETLSFGAMDYVRSPKLKIAPGTPVTQKQLRVAGAGLLHKISIVKKMGPPKRATENTVGHKKNAAFLNAMKTARPAARQHPKYLAIGCSTGGPTTILLLLKKLPQPMFGPILVCQHIDDEFVLGFVDWLNANLNFQVRIAAHGEIPRSGVIYVARGNRNLTVSAAGRLQLDSPPPEQNFTPNINVLFQSMSKNLGKKVVAVVLTGMGSDGAEGLKAIQKNGGAVFIQRPTTSIVSSMPESALEATGVKNGGFEPDMIGTLIGKEC